MFVATVVVAGLLCVYFLLRRPSRAARVAVSIFAVGGLLVGIARIERSGQRVQFGAPVLPRFIWEGFGVPVAIVAVCIAVFLWRALDRIESLAGAPRGADDRYRSGRFRRPREPRPHAVQLLRAR